MGEKHAKKQEEMEKRLVFVIAKADLVPPKTISQWFRILAPIAPTVAVAAEAGREGIKELLELLGHKTGDNAAASEKGAAVVGVLGYTGVGKRAVCKAMRQELKTTAP